MGTWFDIRLAVRSLRRQPGFAAVAVLTLALGIGANTAILSTIHHALLRKPPYKDPDRIAMLRLIDPEEGSTDSLPWSYPYFEDLRARRVPALQEVAALWPWHGNLSGIEIPERLAVEMVSAQYFPLLGVQAARGRVFLPDEDTAPGQPVALVSDALWRRHFGADPGLVGRTISLEDKPLTVVGVMPQGFRGLTGQADVWVPMQLAPTLTFARRLERRYSHFLDVVARVRPGVTREQADAELTGALAQIHQETPPPEDGGYEKLALRAIPLQEDRIDPSFSRALYILFAAVGLVFLIACVNVVNLLLVRAASRHRETAVRVAMGASRGRLVRGFLAESVVLGLLGGVAGLLVAQLGIRLVGRYLPVEVLSTMQLETFRLGAEVFGLNLLLALLTGLLLGVLPAFQATRGNIQSWLKQGPAGVSGTRSLGRLNPLSLLVVSEIALSLVLLIGAGLMLRSFAQLWSVRLGFEPENVVAMSISHTFQEPFGPERMVFYEQMLQKVDALPGVESASVTNLLPVSLEGGERGTLAVDGRTYAESFASTVGVHMIGPRYFDTLSIPILRGRAFTDRDRGGSPRVAILNQAAAEHFFPGENPLGKRVQPSIGWDEGDFAEVVGVVGDVKYGRVEEAPAPALYVPFQQNPYSQVYLLVRTSLSAEALLPTVQKTVRELDPSLPFYDARSLESHLGDTLSKVRFSTLLLTVFAVLACALAAIGLYGVMSYSVSRRTFEIGIRLALGARPEGIFGMILRDALSLAAVGIAIGLALALASTRLLASFLYQLSTADPATFAGVAMLLLAVSAGAAYVPARHALAVEPTTALRSE